MVLGIWEDSKAGIPKGVKPLSSAIPREWSFDARGSPGHRLPNGGLAQLVINTFLARGMYIKLSDYVDSVVSKLLKAPMRCRK
jgi:hypothetical protein